MVSVDVKHRVYLLTCERTSPDKDGSSLLACYCVSEELYFDIPMTDSTLLSAVYIG